MVIGVPSAQLYKFEEKKIVEIFLTNLPRYISLFRNKRVVLNVNVNAK